MKRINDWLALHTTLLMGTMWCVYAFTLFSLLPLWLPKLQNELLYVSNCLQLVALPLLMVGQNLLGQNAERRAAQDHEAIMEELGEVKAMHADLTILVGGSVTVE